MPLQNSDVWFITGCSTGFGRELAKLVLDRGYRAVITARDPSQIQDLIAGHQDRALVQKLDVTDKAEAVQAVKSAESAFGSIDVLVNNAGFGYVGALEESDEDEVRAMMETNFFGLARMIHEVLPGMRRRRRGNIVNVSSIGGLVGFPGVGYYNATKFAVTQTDLQDTQLSSLSSLASSLKKAVSDYYKFLAQSVLARRNKEFWDYHRSRLKVVDMKIDKFRLARNVLYRIADYIFNPKRTIERLFKKLFKRNRPASPKPQPTVRAQSHAITVNFRPTRGVRSGRACAIVAVTSTFG